VHDRSSSLGSATVSYVDLEALFDHSRAIDLLKIDIEGSEETFLTTYPDLLRRTVSVVIEIHLQHCEASTCLSALHQAGLREQIRVEENVSAGTELYYCHR
jgi:hypothetical protein